MTTTAHHEELLQGVAAQFQVILESSEQAIYLYLDDAHKVCNEKFASLLGYNSAKEWAGTEGSFPELFVAEENQNVLVTAYQNAMDKMTGSTIKVTWKKKSGGTVATTVILVPIGYDGHLFALHFVTE